MYNLAEESDTGSSISQKTTPSPSPISNGLKRLAKGPWPLEPSDKVLKKRKVLDNAWMKPSTWIRPCWGRSDPLRNTTTTARYGGHCICPLSDWKVSRLRLPTILECYFIKHHLSLTTESMGRVCGLCGLWVRPGWERLVSPALLERTGTCRPYGTWTNFQTKPPMESWTKSTYHGTPSVSTINRSWGAKGTPATLTNTDQNGNITSVCPSSLVRTCYPSSPLTKEIGSQSM